MLFNKRQLKLMNLIPNQALEIYFGASTPV